jgi:hypothetical protein
MQNLIFILVNVHFTELGYFFQVIPLILIFNQQKHLFVIFSNYIKLKVKLPSILVSFMAI